MLPETISPVDCFTIVGLAFDIVGVSLLFRFAPEKKPHPRSLTFFEPEKHYVDEWEKDNRRRNFWTPIGFLSIIIGFTIQALGAALL